MPSAHTTTSQTAARPAPPPSAAPCTRPTTTRGWRSIASNARLERRGVGEVLGLVVVGDAAHPGEIAARAEGLALASQHDRAEVLAILERQERGLEGGGGVVVEGVSLLGSGDPHVGYVAVDVRRDELVRRHAPDSPRYIRYTGARTGSAGALREAASARPRTSRVCVGEMTPSSQSRADP